MRFIPALLFACTCSFAPLFAKDISRLWYSGGSVAFHSTQDEVGSNADQFGDPRPDDFVNRKMGIEDTASFGLTAGFGLTRWLSLQLDVGYFNGRVGGIEVYLQDTFPKQLDPTRPEVLNGTKHRQITVPISAGLLTQIPVGVSGILRFRQDRTVNPYIGAGLGMIFAGIDETQDIAALNGRLSSLRIIGETSEAERDLVPEKYEALREAGKIPFTYPVSVGVNNGFEWHLMAGMEHFFGDRVSLIADVRYTFAVPTVSVELRGEDQVNLRFFSERLFRPDGSLKIFNTVGNPPNSPADPNDASQGPARCTRNTVGDFDRDGHTDDMCYFNNPSISTDDPEGVFLVQGGRVNLSGYNIQVGMRVYF